jgi:hypothetical protein
MDGAGAVAGVAVDGACAVAGVAEATGGIQTPGCPALPGLYGGTAVGGWLNNWKLT